MLREDGIGAMIDTIIRKSFTFEAAHQLETAFTKACFECIHGHSYTVELFLRWMGPPRLDADDMVLDFSRLAPFKAKVMEAWDHGLILHESKAPHYEPLIAAGLLKREKVSFLTRNPTAETMAQILYGQLQDFLRGVENVDVAAVRVHETSTGYAQYGEL